MVRRCVLTKERQTMKVHAHTTPRGSEKGCGRDGSDPTLRAAASSVAVLIAPAPLRKRSLRSGRRSRSKFASPSNLVSVVDLSGIRMRSNPDPEVAIRDPVPIKWRSKLDPQWIRPEQPSGLILLYRSTFHIEFDPNLQRPQIAFVFSS